MQIINNQLPHLLPMYRTKGVVSMIGDSFRIDLGSKVYFVDPIRARLKVLHTEQHRPPALVARDLLVRLDRKELTLNQSPLDNDLERTLLKIASKPIHFEDISSEIYASRLEKLTGASPDYSDLNSKLGRVVWEGSETVVLTLKEGSAIREWVVSTNTVQENHFITPRLYLLGMGSLRTTGEQQIIGELRPYLDTIVPSKSLTQLKEWVDHQTHQSFAGY